MRREDASEALRAALDHAPAHSSGIRLVEGTGSVGDGRYAACLEGEVIRVWWHPPHGPGLLVSPGQPLAAEPEGVEWTPRGSV